MGREGREKGPGETTGIGVTGNLGQWKRPGTYEYDPFEGS